MMKIINDKKIMVETFDELRDILEGDNSYNYIYLGSDIIMTEGIVLNGNKDKIIIDGTYLAIKHTLTGVNSSNDSDTFVVSLGNNTVEVRNININYTNPSGVIYVPLDKQYKDLLCVYNNVIFKGTQLSYNPYGISKIVDCNITIEKTNEVLSQEVCEANKVIIGGKTTISSSSESSPLFLFRTDVSGTSMVFLCKSEVIISTDTKELMNGTNKLNFTILHDTDVMLTTGNGFSAYTIHGANNVLIDERASFTFIEKNHQRVPMWNVFGSFTMRKGSVLELINSYTSTPTDNYNIYFKGNNCSLNLDNANVAIYTKNANVIYTNNSVNFSINSGRINMWNNSCELSLAGGINDLPSYSWYKEDGNVMISGTFTQTTTTVDSHNFTDLELANLPDLSNFSFQNKKEFSVGTLPMNIHLIDSTSNKISGHTSSYASVLIEYNSVSSIVSCDESGYFEYSLTDSIVDGTEISITSNIGGSFLYITRKVITPHDGELSLMDITKALTFSLVPISSDSLIYGRNNSLVLRVVDSRVTTTKWKIYAYIDKQLTSELGYVLEDALIFKKLDDEIITLGLNPLIVYEEVNNNQDSKLVTITWSIEKGPLLDLTNKSLEANEEYFSNINFSLLE